jgi:hypothetical protein
MGTETIVAPALNRQSSDDEILGLNQEAPAKVRRGSKPRRCGNVSRDADYFAPGIGDFVRLA